MIATALSIAGSDPSGGAGVQADLKAFSAQGVYGMAALTALTAQNTTGVSGVHLVPPNFVAQQIADVFSDVRVNAVKIGMIATADIAAAVAGALEHCAAPIVLDPVMVAKGGHPLLAEDAVAQVRDSLLPLAALVTPNLPEAAALLEVDTATTRDAMERQAHELLESGARAVLMKGGHLESHEAPDLLAAPGISHWVEAPRFETQNTHGTGCSLSAALAAQLARGNSLVEALEITKSWLNGAIAAADTLDIGAGHGPIHHFHALWAR